MSQSKTDKIRERLKEADEYDKHLALEAVEAVVGKCDENINDRENGVEVQKLFTPEEIVDIIAQELGVEEG